MTQALTSLTNTTDGLGDVTMSKWDSRAEESTCCTEKNSYKAGVKDTKKRCCYKTNLITKPFKSIKCW